MEQPQDLMKIIRSLDAIKHADPELFIELLGINPDGGGTSPYFGSFLHKAVFITQRALDRADGLGEMAIKTMLKQLLTLDAKVSTYSGVVSRESLKAMGAQMKERVDAEQTAADKAKSLVMMAVPFTRLAIDAEVRRQLDALREANLENVKAEFTRRLDDIDHPLKFLDYLKSMPRLAFNDQEIYRAIRDVFKLGAYIPKTPDAFYDYIHIHLGNWHHSFIVPLYRRISLLDESRADLGFGHRTVVAIRDIDTIERLFTRMVATSQKDAYELATSRLRLFLGDDALSYAFLKNHVDALSPQLSFVQRRFLNYTFEEISAERLGKERELQVKLGDDPNEVQRIDPFIFGQLLVEDVSRGLNKLAIDILQTIPNPDLVLLSVLANPNGAAVAFEHFDKFCARIEPMRMYKILHDQIPTPSNPPYFHPALKKFYKEFTERKPESHTAAYVAHLRTKILKLHDADSVPIDKDLDLHLKLNRALVEKKTPWTVQAFSAKSGYEHLAQFDLWQSIAMSTGKELAAVGLHYLPIPRADEIEWSDREREFVGAQLGIYGRWKSIITNTIEHGVVLGLHNPDKPDQQSATLKLNLKSQPA